MASARSRTVVRVVLLLGAVVLIGVFVRARTGGDGAHAARSSDAAGAQRPISVALAKVEKKDVPIWLEGLGTIAAWQQVTVHPQVDGRLDKVFFTEGATVHRGEVLAQIDPRPFQAQLHQSEGAAARDRAQVHAAEINLERYKTLRGEKLVAQQQVDDQAALAGQAAGALHTDDAQIEAARLNLDYARVKAPIDGVVGVRLVDAGNLVHAADPTGLVVIAQLDPAALFVTVPQDALPEISSAMHNGEVSVEAWSRDGLVRIGTGKLIVVDNQINQATSTLRLKCQLPNPDRKLWPNQFVKARLLLEVRKAAIVVPPQAVQRGPQGTFVYVVAADNKAESRPIEVALTTADIAVIQKGLTPGENVVIEGQNQLRPGSAVQAHGQGGGPGAAGGSDGKRGSSDGGGRDGSGKGGAPR